MQQKERGMNANTKHFAATALMRAAAQHFQTDDRKFIGSCCWEEGTVSVAIELEDFEIWHTLAHINNVAEATEMLLNNVYAQEVAKKIFHSKQISEAILDQEKRSFDVSKLIRVDKVIIGFLKTFEDG